MLQSDFGVHFIQSQATSLYCLMYIGRSFPVAGTLGRTLSAASADTPALVADYGKNATLRAACDRVSSQSCAVRSLAAAELLAAVRCSFAGFHAAYAGWIFRLESPLHSAQANSASACV